MGLYATTTSLSELLPHWLVSNTTTSDAAGSNIFSRHIDRAEAEINACVANRYSLPFTSTAIPPYLRSLAEDGAAYYTIRGSTVQDLQVRNEMLAPYEIYFERLKDLKDGKIKLTLTDGSIIPVRTGRFLSSTEGYTQIFGLDDATLWKRDSDEIDDQDSARE